MNDLTTLESGPELMTEMAKMARQVNEYQSNIEILERRAISGVNDWLNEVNQCGAILIQLKERQKHGEWLPWLRRHCPRLTSVGSDGAIKAERAQRYMRVAHNWERISKAMRESLLPEQMSLRAALQLCSSSEDSTDSPPPRRWPIEEVIIGKASKLVGDLYKHPLRSWHCDAVEKLREDLEPIARELWPERF
jgi:hypothetical protein